MRSIASLPVYIPPGYTLPGHLPYRPPAIIINPGNPEVPTVPALENPVEQPAERQALVDELYTYIQEFDAQNDAQYWGFESRAWLMAEGSEQWVTNSDLKNLIATAKEPVKYLGNLYPAYWRQYFTNVAYSLTAGGTQDIDAARAYALRLSQTVDALPEPQPAPAPAPEPKNNWVWWIAAALIYLRIRRKRK